MRHSAVCTCPPHYTGDPFIRCNQIVPDVQPSIYHEPTKNPCAPPTSCGPHSECRVINEQAVCSCLRNMIGSPPHCRPECSLNSDCEPNKACINNKCKDPCSPSDFCGINAICRVINHLAICECPDRYSGDPFVTCSLPRQSKILPIHNYSVLKSFKIDPKLIDLFIN